MKKPILIAILASVLIVGFYLWKPFSPKTVEECILEHIKGINDKTVAAMIQDACEGRFPTPLVQENKCELREMTVSEKVLVSGNAAVSSEPYFSARFYNGNQITKIEEITISIKGERIPLPQIYKLRMSYGIGPQASGEAGVSLAIEPGKNFAWNIESLKTCK